MKTGVDYFQDISQSLTHMMTHTVRLEKDVSNLKKVIRIMANAEALDEEGNITRQFSREEAEFIKKVCNELDVFQTGYSQIGGSDGA